MWPVPGLLRYLTFHLTMIQKTIQFPTVVRVPSLVLSTLAVSYLRRESCHDHASERAHSASWRAEGSERLQHMDGVGVGADVEFRCCGLFHDHVGVCSHSHWSLMKVKTF